MVRLGYAYPAGKLLKPPKRKLSETALISAAGENILRIADALEWNSQHEITLFRIPPETVPFDFHLENRGFWKKEIDSEAGVLGEYIRESGIRIFMRGSPSNSLGSPDASVAKRSLDEIEHACAFMDLMGLDYSSKIVLNIGKVHAKRKDTADRFIEKVSNLSASARRRIAIENDASYWPFYDAFGVAGKLRIPIVFNYPAFLENNFIELSPADILRVSSISWKKEDGPQKVLYSEGFSSGKKGTVSRNAFIKFYGEIESLRVDIMLDTGLGGRSVLKAREFLK